MNNELKTELELTKTTLSLQLQDFAKTHNLSEKDTKDLITIGDRNMDIAFHKVDPTIPFGSFKKWR